MQLTIRHVHNFGSQRSLVGTSLDSAGGWDALRLQSEGSFALPNDFAEWQAVARSRPEWAWRAAELDVILSQLGAESIVSYGVGTAMVELLLHERRADVALTVTENAPGTCERLRGMFNGAEVVRHDLSRDDPIPSDLQLFHRVDTELTNSEWQALFARFAHNQIVFVPVGLLSPVGVTRELLRRLRYRGRATRAGWVRNNAAMVSLWNGTHHMESVMVGDLRGWILRPRR